MGGLVLGGLAVAVWQLDAGYGPVLWQRAAVIISTATLLSSGSAAGSLALARMAEKRELRDASADMAEVGLTGDEEQELLGDRG